MIKVSGVHIIDAPVDGLPNKPDGRRLVDGPVRRRRHPHGAEAQRRHHGPGASKGPQRQPGGVLVYALHRPFHDVIVHDEPAADVGHLGVHRLKAPVLVHRDGRGVALVDRQPDGAQPLPAAQPLEERQRLRGRALSPGFPFYVQLAEEQPAFRGLHGGIAHRPAVQLQQEIPVALLRDLAGDGPRRLELVHHIGYLRGGQQPRVMLVPHLIGQHRDSGNPLRRRRRYKSNLHKILPFRAVF